MKASKEGRKKLEPKNGNGVKLKLMM